jgi:hypothetical protein
VAIKIIFLETARKRKERTLSNPPSSQYEGVRFLPQVNAHRCSRSLELDGSRAIVHITALSIYSYAAIATMRVCVTEPSADDALLRVDSSKQVVCIKSQVFKRAPERIQKGDKLAANASGGVREQ